MTIEALQTHASERRETLRRFADLGYDVDYPGTERRLVPDQRITDSLGNLALNEALLPEAENIPRYDLTKEELDVLEKEMVDKVKAFVNNGVAAVWVKPNGQFANFIRTHEANYFPEVEAVSEEDEKGTLFLALVDTRPGVNRVVHGTTVTGVNFEDTSSQTQTTVNPDKTNFYTVDSLIDNGNFSAEDFREYYAQKGIDITKSIAVETNFRIGDKVENFQGFRSADLAYLTLFNLLEARGSQRGQAVVFATINRVQKISFKMSGLAYEPLMGRTDMKTEEAELGIESTPVAIPYDVDSWTLFKSMGVNVPQFYTNS